MNDARVVEFSQLAGADLVLDRIYRGGFFGGMADDPLSKLLRVGNRWEPGRVPARWQPQEGFREAGGAVHQRFGPDWPDALDPYTGTFTYYGDNRRPGQALESTMGNLLLRKAFAWAHGNAVTRVKVPPFLLFDKPGARRDVRFRGLLAPGSDRLSGEEDLVAVWRTTKDMRFQNYRAHFTILDTAAVTRAWIDQLMAGEPLGSHCPTAWRAWVEVGTYAPLLAPLTVIVRSRDE